MSKYKSIMTLKECADAEQQNEPNMFEHDHKLLEEAAACGNVCAAVRLARIEHEMSICKLKARLIQAEGALFAIKGIAEASKWEHGATGKTLDMLGIAKAYFLTSDRKV